MITQLTASASAVAFVFGSFIVFFLLLKSIGILRVPASVEIEGIDIALHGVPAYAGMLTNPDDGTPSSVGAVGKVTVGAAQSAAD
jgi:Amt family ammonium transporter